MMKLTLMRDFFDVQGDEHPIVTAFLEKWGYDQNSVRFLRASQNFILRFQKDQKDYVLRIAHADDRSIEEIQAELDFVTYLSQNGARVNTPLASKTGTYIERQDSELGTLHAVVFDFLPGMHYDMEELDAAQFYRFGEALGDLHRLSRTYGQNKEAADRGRLSWADHLNQARETIPQQEEAAHQELERVAGWLKGLEQTEENFGLIHYDFELDNLIWNNGIQMIDFDGCSYYWYAADFAYASRDLFENGVDLSNPSFRAFVDGYRSKKEIDEQSLAMIPMFLRLHHVVTFAMLLDVVKLDRTPEANPEWVVDLGAKLENKIRQYRESFLQHA